MLVQCALLTSHSQQDESHKHADDPIHPYRNAADAAIVHQ